VCGGIYPAYGIVFGSLCHTTRAYFLVAHFNCIAKGVAGFSDIDGHQRRHDGDRNALW
jgi:hypothetical protein